MTTATCGWLCGALGCSATAVRKPSSLTDASFRCQWIKERSGGVLMCCSAISPTSRLHDHLLNGITSLLLLHLDLMRAVLTHKSKAHAAGAQRSVTRLHTGISACLAEGLHAFIPPS